MFFNRLLNEFSKALFDNKRLVAMSFILKSYCFINVKKILIHFGIRILTIPLPYVTDSIYHFPCHIMFDFDSSRFKKGLYIMSSKKHIDIHRFLSRDSHLYM